MPSIATRWASAGAARRRAGRRPGRARADLRRPPIPHCELRIAGDDGRRRCPPSTSATSRSAAATSRAAISRSRRPTPRLITADGWLRTGDLGADGTRGDLYITGRHKEIIFVNGQNYYPHDLEALILRASPASSSARSPPPACARPRPTPTSWSLFVLHRATWRTSCRSPRTRSRADQRARGPRGRARGAGAAHPEDHQRQDAAPPAGAESYRRRLRRRARRARGARTPPTAAARAARRDRARSCRRSARPRSRQARGHRRQPVRPRRQLAQADRRSTNRSTRCTPARST